MWRFSVAISHSGTVVKAFREGRMPFRTTSVQINPTWRTTQLNSLLPCWMVIVDGLYVKLALRWIPHDISKVQLWHRYAVAQAFFGPIPKGRWQLSWTNRRYRRNLSSLIRTNLEMLIKWKEASRLNSCKESAPYTMCCQGIVHYCVWHWRNHTAPRCTFKTVNPAYQCTFLQHHLRPALRRKLRHLMVQNPIILHDNARSHPAAAATDLLAHAITISSPKWKNHSVGPGTTQEMNLSVL